MMLRHFKAIVLDAQGIYENSWNKRTKKYKLTQHDAAVKACENAGQPKEWAMPVQLLNITAWNDVQLWTNGGKQ